MIFLWSKSNRIGSRVIRWGIGEPSSHFSAMFFEGRGDDALVIESRLSTGVRRISFKEWKRHNQIVHALKCPPALPDETALYGLIWTRLRGRQYDQWAMAYWVYAGLALRLFRRKLPHKNAWGKNELVYCVEILELMGDYLGSLGIDLSGVDVEMLSPEGSYKILRDCKALIVWPG